MESTRGLWWKPSGAPGWPAAPRGVRGTEGDQEPLGLCATRGWLCAPHAGHAYVCCPYCLLWPWIREWYYTASYGGPETRRVTRKWQGEICGPSFRLPLSTGGTSQLDTCKQPRSFIPSLIHLFIQPEKCLLRGSLSVPICKTERVTAPQWAVVEITDVSM